MTRLWIPSPSLRIHALAAGLALLVAAPVLAQKPVVRTEADLPRFSYPLPAGVANASELLENRAALDTVAAHLEADLRALLADYTIEDAATLTGLHTSLSYLALLRGDDDEALAEAAAGRETIEKPADRLVAGLSTQAVVAAHRAGAADEARHAAFRAHYAASVAALPWDVVQDNLERTKGRAETGNANLVRGSIHAYLDSTTASTRQISGDDARGLVAARVSIDVVFPFNEDIVAVLAATIAANRIVKPDIWAARDVTLSAADGLTPVVIGIWDTGVDAGVFGDQMFTNPDETADGRDDDGDGFVDDLHGIVNNPVGETPSTDPLYPLSDAQRARLPEVLRLIKGRGDIDASIDSPEAGELRRRLAQIQPDEVGPFIEELTLFAGYVHGTHVAGIAAAGNPAARLLVVRHSFPYKAVEPPSTLDLIRSEAVFGQRAVDYMRRHGVRVVNMSWIDTAKFIEDNYEANGIGETAEERHQMAQEAFDVEMTAMTAAIRSAPDILFVPAAGNSNGDTGFEVAMPASIALPNVLTVGAVDQAGEETSFTSHGATVRVYASGFEVESTVPGGSRLALSGTSMAAPQVTNLAAKLFALDPSLTPERVVALILGGADRSADGRIALLNPARSVALLRGAE